MALAVHTSNLAAIAQPYKTSSERQKAYCIYAHFGNWALSGTTGQLTVLPKPTAELQGQLQEDRADGRK